MRDSVLSDNANSGMKSVRPRALTNGANPVAMLSVTAPYDGALIADVGLAGMQHVEQSLITSHCLFKDKSRWLSLVERVGVLERTAKIMLHEINSLAMTAALEGGKPLLDSLAEVQRAIDGVKLCAEHLRSFAGTALPMRGSAASGHHIAFSQPEPVGVAVAISAFIHPLDLIVHQAATAIASGCPVIVMPAVDTPLSCLAFSRILHQAGLPMEWCQVIVTDSTEVSESLVTDRRVAYFSFIGNPAVGWTLRSKLSPGVRCMLQHGGAAPVILMEDADRAKALNCVVKGGFYHAGQVCVSVQRVLVPHSYSQDFADALAARAARLTVGDPCKIDTEVGPLIRAAEVQRVDAWVKEAIAGGAKLLAGGRVLGESMFLPTVLLNPPHDARISREEIFGPVLCVYDYKEVDQSIRIANNLPSAHGAAVFTESIDSALYVYKQLCASAVIVNDHTAFRADGMPFAGLWQSGFGTGGIPYAIDDMQINKMLVLHSPGL